MLQGLLRTAPHVVPFVRQFHGSLAIQLWESDDGVTHHIPQGEGGEQCCLLSGNTLLVAALRRLSRVVALLRHKDPRKEETSVERHGKKKQVLNAVGIRPPVCDELDRVAQAEDPEAPISLERLRFAPSAAGHQGVGHPFWSGRIRRGSLGQNFPITRFCWIVFPCFRTCSPRGLSHCTCESWPRTSCGS